QGAGLQAEAARRRARRGRVADCARRPAAVVTTASTSPRSRLSVVVARLAMADNQRLKLSGGAILVFRASLPMQAAPAGELWPAVRRARPTSREEHEVERQVPQSPESRG